MARLSACNAHTVFGAPSSSEVRGLSKSVEIEGGKKIMIIFARSFRTSTTICQEFSASFKNIYVSEEETTTNSTIWLVNVLINC